VGLRRGPAPPAVHQRQFAQQPAGLAWIHTRKSDVDARPDRRQGPSYRLLRLTAQHASLRGDIGGLHHCLSSSAACSWGRRRAGVPPAVAATRPRTTPRSVAEGGRPRWEFPIGNACSRMGRARGCASVRASLNDLGTGSGLLEKPSGRRYTRVTSSWGGLGLAKATQSGTRRPRQIGAYRSRVRHTPRALGS
jgi:hypothetical protein